MIINMRGTSGSGKSTLVRRVMAAYDTKIPIREEGRRQPLGYILSRAGQPGMKGNGKSLFVVGHYETACGGCDTIPKLDRIYEIVRLAHQDGMNVLFEGLLISAEVNRCQALLDIPDCSVVVIALTEMSVELCVESVNIRRRRKDPAKEDVNPKNTAAKYKQVKRACERLREAGMEVHQVDRKGAWEVLDTKLDLE